MQAIRHNIRRGLLILTLLSACSDIIEYSPFEVKVSDKNINSKNIQLLSINNNEEFAFAYLSDTHSFYDEFLNAINLINKDNEILFVIVGGDFTNLGLSQEYEWYLQCIKKIRVPVLTLIGNHDYLSNGGYLYEKMFSPTNFSFILGNYKFIFFDDVVWENNNKSPNFNWLLSQFLNDNTTKKILITHIPPWSDQIEKGYQKFFIQILKNNTPFLMLFGHTHKFDQGRYYNIPYLVSGTIEDKRYYKITICKEQFKIDKINF